MIKIFIGTDIVNNTRIIDIISKYGENFVNKICNIDEIGDYTSNLKVIASKFAAKEAVMKALGTGMTVNFKDILIKKTITGAPIVELIGQAKIVAESLLNNFAISLSISHDGNYTIANVILYGK